MSKEYDDEFSRSGSAGRNRRGNGAAAGPGTDGPGTAGPGGRGMKGYRKEDPAGEDYFLDEDYYLDDDYNRMGGDYADETAGREDYDDGTEWAAGDGRAAERHSYGGTAGTGYRADRSTGSMGQRGGKSTGASDRQTGGNTARQSSVGSLSGGSSSGRQTARAASRSAQMAAKAKKTRRIIVMSILEVFVLAGIFAFAYVSNLMNSINRPSDYNKENVINKDLSPENIEHMQGYLPIAIFGVDSRDGNVDKGTNADVIMICNLNRDTGEIRLVSVFRDTYLNISEKDVYNKINSAYSNGGPQQAVSALNRNLDLNIVDYVTFNWKAVADGINMLGGVDVEISKTEFYYINSFITETVEKTGVGSHHLKKAGLNHLDGVQAVAYGRLRLMDTDYARTERQRLIIQKAFEKAKQADIGMLEQLLRMEFDQINTNLTLPDFTYLLMDLSRIHIGETGGFPFARDSMVMGKKGDCVIPLTLESNVIELHRFLFDEENYTPSDTVKKISARIAADSGKYKEGTNVYHVPTDGGYIPKPTAGETKEDETSKGETESTKESIAETDEDGNPIESESPEETSPGETKPGETKPGETKPGETKPGETKPGETKPGETRPGETKPGETKPGETKPGGLRPDETSRSDEPGSISPGDQTEPGESGGPGEGMKPTETIPHPTSAAESEDGLGSTTGPGASSTRPSETASQNVGGGPSQTVSPTESTKPSGNTGTTVVPVFPAA